MGFLFLFFFIGTVFKYILAKRHDQFSVLSAVSYFSAVIMLPSVSDPRNYKGCSERIATYMEYRLGDDGSHIIILYHIPHISH